MKNDLGIQKNNDKIIIHTKKNKYAPIKSVPIKEIIKYEDNQEIFHSLEQIEVGYKSKK